MTWRDLPNKLALVNVIKIERTNVVGGRCRELLPEMLFSPDRTELGATLANNQQT